MIDALRCVLGDGTDPYRNLAVEQTLLETVAEGECILYLWQNQRTVVIGRNQNALRECRLAALEADGGHLARRLSGGGAVYHDLGNLNFTFLVRKADYDLDRQLRVLLTACRALGVPAERSGRNDLLADGRKFSGNAFYDSGGRAYHHGTLLIDADMTALSRYLAPSPAKLRAKGVDSVRSRVVNLRALRPDLTTDALRDALTAAFEEVYGGKASQLYIEELDNARIASLTARNGGADWLLGQRRPYTCAGEARFDWGELRAELRVEKGVVRDAALWSDALDWTLTETLQTVLTGCPFTLPALEARLRAPDAPPEGADLLTLLRTQIF